MEDINNSYLSFKIGSETFAMHVGKVNEIREYETPRNMPETISFMKGVIDYREDVVPVIDTGIKFGMKPIEVSSQTCIIIIDVVRKDSEKTFKVGILTDAVTDVFELTDSEFKEIESDYRPNYIKATCKINDAFYLILNTDEVFSINDIVEMGSIIKKINK